MRGGGRGRPAAAAAAEELRDSVVVVVLLNSGRASFSSPLLLQRHQTREKARFKIKSVSFEAIFAIACIFFEIYCLTNMGLPKHNSSIKKSRLTLPLSSWWVTHVLCFYRRWFWWSPVCDRSLCSFIRETHSLIFFWGGAWRAVVQNL